ncbi:MAG: fibronectin type III domain-containing protein [Velocimicrobium sp.]
MKKLTRVICVVAFCLVAMMGMSNVSGAEEVQYTDNVILAMIDNFSAGGTAIASSSIDASYAAYKVFDGLSCIQKTTPFSVWLGSPMPAWLGYNFSEAKCITKYTISPIYKACINYSPKSWTFEAWDDGTKTWVVLNTQEKVTNWEEGIKKEYTFSNSKFYKTYRINITANCGGTYVAVGELEMMETISSTISTQYQVTNLTASPGNKSVALKWDKITEAESYIIKYGTSADSLNQTRTTSASEYSNFVIDGLVNGTKYYFTVSSIVGGVEKEASNIVSATPSEVSDYDFEGNSAILEIVMTNGTIKEYSLTIDEVEDFLTWYDNRADGIGKSYYRILKKSNVKPFLSRKEYLSFDKIYSFEVKEYNE